MMTKHIWALTTAALIGTACTSEAGTTNSDESSVAPTGQSTGSATQGTMPSGSNTSGQATNTGTSGSTGGSSAGADPSSGTMSRTPVSTGSPTGQAAAGSGGSTATATTMMESAGTAGSATMIMMDDDSDAGVMVGEVESMGADAGMANAAGAGGTGTAGMGSAGTAGTETSAMPQVPSDPAEMGPWPVGVRTLSLSIGVSTTPVEVWYPALPGSESEHPKVTYDLTAWLPPEHGIPPEAPKVHIDCDCYRDLPPDTEHGQFPVVVVVHGQASFRAAFASQMSHWASRGFIAIAADHPGLLLRDALAGYGCSGTGIPQDFAHTRDVPALFGQLTQPDGIFAFLKDAVDTERVALGGHGDGAAYAADNADQPGVQVVLSFSDNSVIPAEGTVSAAFFLSGMSDKIVPYNNVVRAYETTARALRPSLLAGMAHVGHLGFTDMCGARNSDGQDAIAMARRYDICGGAAINVADQYFWDCPLSPLAGTDNYLDPVATNALVRKLSTLALEELLLGQSHTAEWNALAADSSWGELRQTR